MFKVQFFEENAGIKILQILTKFICMCTYVHVLTLTHTHKFVEAMTNL